MQVVLLGTGGADGRPNPFCRCATCASDRAAGRLRAPTAALIDDVLLVDCGPEAPRAAERAGRPLDRVRTLLLTHSHPDHIAPAALLWRHWAGRSEPLLVAGPVAAVEACRDWLAPGDPVELRALAPGEALDLGDHLVRALPADHGDAWSGEALLYDIARADGGGRLLYATDTGPSLPELGGARYDALLLEESFGDHLEHGTRHLDLATFPQALRRLRSAGAVDDATEVVAIHLTHHNPPEDALRRRLAAWGARPGVDGEVLAVGEAPGHPALPPAPRRVLVLGGVRSGKSLEAERRLAAAAAVTYVATGGERAGDLEWAERVAAHRARRPTGWHTAETLDVAGALSAAAPGEAVLVDCLALWLAGLLDTYGAWDEPPPAGPPQAQSAPDAAKQVARAVEELVDALRHTRAARVVLVSNEVGLGVVPATWSGRLYRDLLGQVNAAVSAVCDETVLMVAGRPLTLP
jgi:adenosylcobinamide kinase/adenosylcobinamide-phosphate guanylyltransferase